LAEKNLDAVFREVRNLDKLLWHFFGSGSSGVPVWPAPEDVREGVETARALLDGVLRAFSEEYARRSDRASGKPAQGS